MSDKRKSSEKHRGAEKREKPVTPRAQALPGLRKAESTAPGKPVTPAPNAVPGVKSPEEFVSNLMRCVEATGQMIAKIVEDKDKRKGAFTVAGVMADSGKLFAPIVQFWMNDPKGYADARAKLGEDMIELWGRTYKRLPGRRRFQAP